MHHVCEGQGSPAVTSPHVGRLQLLVHLLLLVLVLLVQRPRRPAAAMLSMGRMQWAGRQGP